MGRLGGSSPLVTPSPTKLMRLHIASLERLTSLSVACLGRCGCTPYLDSVNSTDTVIWTSTATPFSRVGSNLHWRTASAAAIAKSG